MTKLSARRVQTREKLMRAAMQVFAEVGIMGASVEEICEAAGFTRGAFYSNFGDKDALVLALIQQCVIDGSAAASKAIAAMREAEDLPAPELITVAMNAYEALDAPWRQNVLTQHELLLYAARRPGIRQAYLEFEADSVRQLATLITEGLIERGLEFSLDADTAVQLIIAAHERVHLGGLFQGSVDTGPLRALLMAITRPVSDSGTLGACTSL